MSSAPFCVGVDIGGSWARLLAEGSDGRRLEAPPVPVPTGYDDLVRAVLEMVPAEASGNIESVGCGLPGTSDGQRAGFVPALPWLEGRDLAADLSRSLGAPVRLGNDGQFTLLAEVSEGAAKGALSAVLVTVGTGIGGAVMTDGRIWRGHHGSAGSWGWLPGQNIRPVGGHGPFELDASGTALAGLARSLRGLGPAALFEAARQGESDALEVVASYAEKLGRGMAALASIIDPEVLVIGGGVSAAFDLLGPLLVAALHDMASPDGARVAVRPAALGPRAGVVGAVLAARAPGSHRQTP